MKKNIFYIIIISIIIGLCACHNTENNGTSNIETVLYRTAEDGSIFDIERTTEFDTKEYIDNSAAKTIELKILDSEYTLEYENSAILPMSDLKVHVYCLQGLSNSKIFIDSQNENVVKYFNIPHTENLNTETDFTDFICNLVGSKIHLDEYEYKCTTHYYSFSDLGMESKVQDGFHICNENERLGTYSFYYTKSINDIKTDEHVSAEFYENMFILEIYDFDYQDSVYDTLLKEINSVDNNIKSYFELKVKNIYDIKNVTITSKRMFVKNGVPYVYSKVNISFYNNNDKSTLYQTSAEVISKLIG